MEVNFHHENEGGRDPSSKSSNGRFENVAQSVVDDDTIARADTQNHEVYRDSESSTEADDTTARTDAQKHEVYRDSELPSGGPQVYRDGDSSHESDDDTAARHDAQNREGNPGSEAKAAVGDGTTTLDNKPKTHPQVYRDSGSSSETDDETLTRKYDVRPDF